MKDDGGIAYRTRGPKHVDGEVSERKLYRGGTIEVFPLIPNRPRVKPAVGYRAIPGRAGKSEMTFSNEADAKRWIEENEIGGNPNGFIREIAARQYRR